MLLLPGWVLLWALLGAGEGAQEPPAAGLLLELSLGKFRNFLLNESVPAEAVLKNIAGNVTVILFQMHAHHQNVTISFDKEPSPNNSGTGIDKGLISVLRPEQTVCTWYLRAVGSNQVLSTAVSLPYTEKDPIPGGCNLEFDLETDPNLYLEYNVAETHIKFAPANLGYARETRKETVETLAYVLLDCLFCKDFWCYDSIKYRGSNPLPCDSGTSLDTRWRLYYDVYQYFLPENDLSEATFVSHMKRMSEAQSIRAHGSKMMTLTSQDKTELYFSSLPGQGVIYNVIVRDPKWNTSAAYVPVHTYACSFSALVNNCYTFRRLSTKIFFTTLALLGLFICFFGHRFWKTGLFFSGFIFTAFFFYIVITKTSALNYDVNLGLTATAGIIGGLLLVGSWWLFGLVIPCMLIVGVVLGFLVSSSFFFTPIGDYKIFQDDAVYWVSFCCVALVIPVIFVCCPRVLNILTCGFVGSYTVVLATACYIYTSLSYIGIDLLWRILNEDFKRAYTSVPFQPNDIILVSVWSMLAIGGITIQLRRERHEAPFPPHPYRMWKRERERRVTNILDPSHHVPPWRERIHNKLSQIKDVFRKEQTAGERTPLLL